MSLTPLLVATVLVAGSLGAVVRYLLSRAYPVRPGHLPGGILIVNVVGSAVAGVALGLAERAALSADWRLVIVTGFCGGLTTFSTWSVETIELADGGRGGARGRNGRGSRVGGVGAGRAGYLLAR